MYTIYYTTIFSQFWQYMIYNWFNSICTCVINICTCVHSHRLLHAICTLDCTLAYFPILPLNLVLWTRWPFLFVHTIQIGFCRVSIIVTETILANAAIWIQGNSDATIGCMSRHFLIVWTRVLHFSTLMMFKKSRVTTGESPYCAVCTDMIRKAAWSTHLFWSFWFMVHGSWLSYCSSLLDPFPDRFLCCYGCTWLFLHDLETLTRILVVLPPPIGSTVNISNI